MLHMLRDKIRIYEVSGHREFKDYGCSIDFVKSPFLVQEWKVAPTHNGGVPQRETLKVGNFCNDEDDASFWSCCWIKPDATFQAKIVWSAGSVSFWQWRMLYCCCQVAIVVVLVVWMACFPLGL
ncbi:protein trichome birefringence [Trifolium repens]|nr:protein trichome birefringence [Trifolium repens]